MNFDTDKQRILDNAYYFFCNYSQTKPSKSKLNRMDEWMSEIADKEISNIKYLENLGYLDNVNIDGDIVYYHLSPKGYEYFNPPASQPQTITNINQGNVVIGNNNSVDLQFGSDVIAEIAMSDIDVAHRKLLIELLEDLNQDTDKTTKISKIRNFITKIAGNALEQSATSSLVFLLQKALQI